MKRLFLSPWLLVLILGAWVLYPTASKKIEPLELSKIYVLSPVTSNPVYGKFTSDPILSFPLGEPREAKLLEDFTFIDKRGKTWTAKKWTKDDPSNTFNGSSIPRFFWSTLGSPFIGNHRAPSIIHDYFFRKTDYDIQEVNLVFYESLLSSGLPIWDALRFYAAVSVPAWLGSRKNTSAESGGGVLSDSDRVLLHQLDELMTKKEKSMGNMNPADILKFIEESKK